MLETLDMLGNACAYCSMQYPLFVVYSLSVCRITQQLKVVRQVDVSMLTAVWGLPYRTECCINRQHLLSKVISQLGSTTQFM